MAEHDVRAAKRQEAAIARINKKHAREVQVEVEKATVELKGEVTKKGRMARRSEADVKSLQAERSKIMDELERTIADRNDKLKRIGRERRQWDVDRQAMVEKCGVLSDMVTLRDKQDASKKRQHKLAMTKANEVCTQLKAKMKDILQQEGRFMYARKKFARDIGLEKQSVTLAMTRVKSDQKKVNKMDDRLQQRADNLLRRVEGVERDRRKVDTAKKVVFFAVSVFTSLHLLSSFFSLRFPCSRLNVLGQQRSLPLQKRSMPSESKRKQVSTGRALN